MIGRFFHACLSRSSDDIDSFGADALGGDDPDNVGTCRELLHVDAQLVSVNLGAVHPLTHGVEYRDLFHALGFNVHLAVCGVGIDLGSIAPVANTHAVLHDNAHAGAAFIAAIIANQFRYSDMLINDDAQGEIQVLVAGRSAT